MEEMNLKYNMDPQKFERMCKQLIIAEFPEAKPIEGKGGDEGIDVYLGNFGGEMEVVFQVKYFTETLASSQKGQIIKSLERANEKHDFKKWILCIAKEFTPSEQRWFDGLKNKFLDIEFDYWGENKIKNMLLKHPPIKESYFPNRDSERLKEVRDILSKNETYEYELLSIRDLSYREVRRYEANILVNPVLQKDSIKNIIRDATEKIKNRQFYRNKFIKDMLNGVSVQIIWINVYKSLEDFSYANWMCQASWIDEKLNELYRPSKFIGNDKIDNIEIYWNEYYEESKNFHKKNSVVKERYIENIENIWIKAKKSVDFAIKLLNRYEKKEISYKEYVYEMQKKQKIFRNLYFESGNLPNPPLECADLDKSFQQVMAIGDEIFQLSTEKGPYARSENERMKILKNYIKKYSKEIERFNFEREKIGYFGDD